MENPSLLIISPNYKPRLGGSAELTHKLALALCAAGWRVALMAPGQPGDKEFDRDQPFTTVRASFTTSGPRRYIEFWRLLRRLIRERQTRFVLASTTIPIGWLAALSLLGIPRGIIFHGNDLYKIKFRSQIRRRLYGFFVRRGAAVFTNSRFTAGLARDVLGLRSEPVILGCGVSPELLPPPVSQAEARRLLGIEARHVLLTVGRLAPHKGVDMTLRALPRIIEKTPDLLYLVAGEGRYQPKLEQLARELGVAAHTRFIGAFADEELARLYCAADVFVMPSRAVPLARSVEGFGIVFIEAGHYRLPVIGGNAGGAPDAIENGRTGLLVDPENPEAIGEAIARLLENPDLARRMGQAGRRRVEEQMNWSRVARLADRAMRAAIGPTVQHAQE